MVGWFEIFKTNENVLKPSELRLLQGRGYYGQSIIYRFVYIHIPVSPGERSRKKEGGMLLKSPFKFDGIKVDQNNA